MKIMNRKFLAAGLLAGALTFVGCKSDKSAERTGDTTQTPPADTTDQGTTTPPAEGTGTQTNSGTGGSGDISKTKQSDDNLRMPREDPLRTPESESIRGAESEDERGVHDDKPGTGGSGFTNDVDNDVKDDDLNEGGSVDDTTRIPDSPAGTSPDNNPMMNETQIPEGTR
jgi:hypothetical protein